MVMLLLLFLFFLTATPGENSYLMLN